MERLYRLISQNQTRLSNDWNDEHSTCSKASRKSAILWSYTCWWNISRGAPVHSVNGPTESVSQFKSMPLLSSIVSQTDLLVTYFFLHSHYNFILPPRSFLPSRSPLTLPCPLSVPLTRYSLSHITGVLFESPEYQLRYLLHISVTVWTDQLKFVRQYLELLFRSFFWQTVRSFHPSPNWSASLELVRKEAGLRFDSVGRKAGFLMGRIIPYQDERLISVAKIKRACPGLGTMRIQMAAKQMHAKRLSHIVVASD